MCCLAFETIFKYPNGTAVRLLVWNSKRFVYGTCCGLFGKLLRLRYDIRCMECFKSVGIHSASSFGVGILFDILHVWWVRSVRAKGMKNIYILTHSLISQGKCSNMFYFVLEHDMFTQTTIQISQVYSTSRVCAAWKYCSDLLITLPRHSATSLTRIIIINQTQVLHTFLRNGKLVMDLGIRLRVSYLDASFM